MFEFFDLPIILSNIFFLIKLNKLLYVTEAKAEAEEKEKEEEVVVSSFRRTV